jgi:hypothetical protein
MDEARLKVPASPTAADQAIIHTQSRQKSTLKILLADVKYQDNIITRSQRPSYGRGSSQRARVAHGSGPGAHAARAARPWG